MAEKKRKKRKRILITIVIFLIFFISVLPAFQKRKKEEQEESRFWQILSQEINRQMQMNYFMLPIFLEEGKAKESWEEILIEAAVQEVPLYSYALSYKEQDPAEDDKMEALIHAQEGSDEDRKEIAQSDLDYDENALHIENSVVEEMQKENNSYLEKEKEQETHTGSDQKEENSKGLQAETEEEKEENGTEAGNGFQIAQYPAYTYDWSENWGYEELVSNFYAIDNTTSLKEEYMNLEKLLYRDLSIEKKEDEEGPQILIYHTHSQEAFADSVPGDPSTTIVGAGDKLTQLLEEKYGFRVLHHTGEYDVENRDYAYSNSLPAIEQILAENPTIEVVIDLHRDAIKEGDKLVMDLQGRPTARFMFFNGMSYIRDKGDISYLENPYMEENLAFSFQAQVVANEYYPGIARRIYLKAYRYNMHLCPKSMLIELGAQTNTVEEIMNACDPLAHIIAIVLNGEI